MKIGILLYAGDTKATLFDEPLGFYS